MGDTSIATDILNAVSEAMDQDVGKSLVLRHFTEGALNPSNPGAGPTRTPNDVSSYGIISAYDDKRIDGTNVLKGDMECVLSLKEITSVVPRPGMQIVDGSTEYEIIRANIPEVAGVGVVAILQLRK